MFTQEKERAFKLQTQKFYTDANVETEGTENGPEDETNCKVGFSFGVLYVVSKFFANRCASGLPSVCSTCDFALLARVTAE